MIWVDDIVAGNHALHPTLRWIKRCSPLCIEQVITCDGTNRTAETIRLDDEVEKRARRGVPLHGSHVVHVSGVIPITIPDHDAAREFIREGTDHVACVERVGVSSICGAELCDHEATISECVVVINRVVPHNTIDGVGGDQIDVRIVNEVISLDEAVRARVHGEPIGPRRGVGGRGCLHAPNAKGNFGRRRVYRSGSAAEDRSRPAVPMERGYSGGSRSYRLQPALP